MNLTTSPKIPRSIEGLHDLLIQAHAHGMKLKDSNEKVIDLSFLGSLGRVKDQLSDLLDTNQALVQAKQEVLERQRTYGTLLLEELNLARQGLKTRVERGMHSNAVYKLYGVHPSRGYTDSPVRMALLQKAERFLEGEVLAIDSEGLPPMVYPVAAELQALIDEARPVYIEATDTQNELTKNQMDIRQYRGVVTRELSKLTRQLRYDLRELIPSAIRNIMRNFGFVFDDLTPEEDENGGTSGTSSSGTGTTPEAKSGEKKEQAKAEEMKAEPEKTKAPQKADAENKEEEENDTKRRRKRNKSVDRSMIAEIRQRIHQKVFGSSAPEQPQSNGHVEPPTITPEVKPTKASGTKRKPATKT